MEKKSKTGRRHIVDGDPCVVQKNVKLNRTQAKWVEQNVKNFQGYVRDMIAADMMKDEERKNYLRKLTNKNKEVNQ